MVSLRFIRVRVVGFCAVVKLGAVVEVCAVVIIGPGVSPVVVCALQRG
jgi:hypothetical protein